MIITIDEVLHNDNMRRFASQFQIFLREDYPVFLLMTRLYENIYAIQNDPSLTFLLRSPKITLEPLSMLQITTQYKNIFDVSLEKAKELAMPSDASIKVQDLCSAIDMTSASFSRYRERLINKGIIYTPQRGYVEFVLPRFSQVIQMY